MHNIDWEEYKMLRYADDTSLITDGSPKSFDGIFQTLDLYANVSRLKLIFSKTKIIWIGCKKKSQKKFISVDANLLNFTRFNFWE